MSDILYVLVRTLGIFIDVILLALLVRAILSWFTAPDGGRKFYQFLLVLTEPILLPVRSLFAALNWFQNSPFDLSYFVTCMILSVISSFLVV